MTPDEYMYSDDTVPSLRIVNYVEINDKNRDFIFTNYALKGKTFYKAHISEQLIKMINQNFLNISMDTIEPPNPGVIYDGPGYCYCIKIKGQKEKFYYYNPYALPNSWKGVYHQLDSLIESDTIENISEPNDFKTRINEITQRFDWHKTKIIKRLKSTIKFEPPIIKQENEN
jgi:hypothetical protein